MISLSQSCGEEEDITLLCLFMFFNIVCCKQFFNVVCCNIGVSHCGFLLCVSIWSILALSVST